MKYASAINRLRMFDGGGVGAELLGSGGGCVGGGVEECRVSFVFPSWGLGHEVCDCGVVGGQARWGVRAALADSSRRV